MDTPSMSTTVGNLLDVVGQVVTKAVDWMGDITSAITGDALLTLAVVGVPLCGLGIGYLTRLLRRKV